MFLESVKRAAPARALLKESVPNRRSLAQNNEAIRERAQTMQTYVIYNICAYSTEGIVCGPVPLKTRAKKATELDLNLGHCAKI